MLVSNAPTRTRSMNSLYLLRLGKTNRYKIGVSRRPCTRREQVANGKHTVEIVGVWPNLAHLERTLHRRFAATRLNPADMPTSGGTEWFTLTAADVEEIRTECALERMKRCLP